uniref:APC membrane recruitment protein 1 n=1 Tax=Iconisemion striatum TaxID=60296 RepID=A0A1A7Y525_9TELE
MTSRKQEELPSGPKDSPPRAVQQPGSDGIKEELQSDPVNTTVKSQKPGKFKRTALTFFGVRKSICILPSFFGGRSKNQSKKGLCKSRTYDGLSKVSHDDCQRGGCVSAGDFDFHSQRGAPGELHGSCPRECCHNTDRKSLTLGRQRKGLRSLFQSFKQHRGQRNAESDKTESSPKCKKEVPVVQLNTKHNVTECLGSEPDVPDFTDVMCNIAIGPECSLKDTKASENSDEEESPKSEHDDQVCGDQLEGVGLVAVVPGGYVETSRRSSEPCLKLQKTSEFTLKSQTPASSSDQLNLIFGDVASLKSFDSLTGCGDIIADQEDDSFTESTVSGERSRNGGKRASCYLTYQGGGEEMASPEDLDETCLGEFWENNVSEEVCCACDPEQTDVTAESTSSHNVGVMSSSSAQQAGGVDTSMSDVLTPQSEHQESVPNSDEGYYDSATPGPDEGQEKSGRLRAARLPRDSYSGDALYELFAPDESLMSPRYENKSQLPSANHGDCLAEPVDVTDSVFVTEMSCLQISAELYKDDFLELPSTCSKSSVLAQKAMGLQEIRASKNCNLNSKRQTPASVNNTNPDVCNEKGNVSPSTEKRTISTSTDCEERRGSLSLGSASDPDFETFCEPEEQLLEENKPVALPYRNINSQSEDRNSYVDDGQTVCFSQALVDYTKHSEMLSDLETNSTFTPNMEALPTIVTFDVVDMHNEGEYDNQIRMELEEDPSSPFEEFEESYLQKYAFAESDYQMLELYEQNLISNTWAVASLPRHLGLTRVGQSMLNPLSLDRRSRSLDTDSLELKMPDTHRENRAALVSRPQSEEGSERACSPCYKKNVVLSMSEVGDSNGIMALSWQTRSEMALSLPLTDGEITEKVQGLGQPQVRHKLFPCSPDSDFKSKSQHCCSNASDNSSCDSATQHTELYSRQCHLPLCSDSRLPRSSFVYSGLMEDSDDTTDIFCQSSANLQSYNQGRSLVGREGMSYNRGPLKAGMTKDDMAILGESKTLVDGMIPVACSEHPEASCD